MIARIEIVEATAKSQKNAAKTMPTLQNRGGQSVLTLASWLCFSFPGPCKFPEAVPCLLICGLRFGRIFQSGPIVAFQ